MSQDPEVLYYQLMVHWDQMKQLIAQIEKSRPDGAMAAVSQMGGALDRNIHHPLAQASHAQLAELVSNIPEHMAQTSAGALPHGGAPLSGPGGSSSAAAASNYGHREERKPSSLNPSAAPFQLPSSSPPPPPPSLMPMIEQSVGAGPHLQSGGARNGNQGSSGTKLGNEMHMHCDADFLSEFLPSRGDAMEDSAALEETVDPYAAPTDLSSHGQMAGPHAVRYVNPNDTHPLAPAHGYGEGSMPHAEPVAPHFDTILDAADGGAADEAHQLVATSGPNRPGGPHGSHEGDVRHPNPRGQSGVGADVMRRTPGKNSSATPADDVERGSRGGDDEAPRDLAYVEFKRQKIKKYAITPLNSASRGHGDVGVCLENDDFPSPGQLVLVDGDRGMDCGLLVQTARQIGNGEVQIMCMEGTNINEGKMKLETGRLLRAATPEEIDRLHKVIGRAERAALKVCQQRCSELGIGIDILDCEYQFDMKKISFYFNADYSVDFRQLVRDLYRTFGARIWMENVNPRVRNSMPGSHYGEESQSGSAHNQRSQRRGRRR